MRSSSTACAGSRISSNRSGASALTATWVSGSIGPECRAQRHHYQCGLIPTTGPGKVCGKPRISVSDGPDAVLPSRADPSLMVTTSLAERLAAPGARPLPVLERDVCELMTPGVTSMVESASLARVFEAFAAHRVHALVVTGAKSGQTARMDHRAWAARLGWARCIVAPRPRCDHRKGHRHPAERVRRGSPDDAAARGRGSPPRPTAPRRGAGGCRVGARPRSQHTSLKRRRT